MSESRIFISWSLPSSQRTAAKAYAFFRKLFPTFSFFYSSENISTGQRWYDVISDRLDDCNIGVIVVTKENYLRPWIHYEAGALAKVVTKARVMPLLCGVSNRLVADTPLSAFQAADLGKAGIRRIADSIREITGYEQDEADFSEHFESLWERYGEALGTVESEEEIVSGPVVEEAPTSENETSSRLDQLTEIVRSIESRLPHRPLSEGDVLKIIAANALNPPPVRLPLSDDEFYRIIGLDHSNENRNALAHARLVTQPNALSPERDKPARRRGLLSEHDDSDGKD